MLVSFTAACKKRGNARPDRTGTWYAYATRGRLDASHRNSERSSHRAHRVAEVKLTVNADTPFKTQTLYCTD